ncbi:hypothetical protein, partial [Francisella tularensis]|uniref:hypothetical protein n=1 Tax=Francisella tularensis TaxID=263 RepID=UPI002381B0FF
VAHIAINKLLFSVTNVKKAPAGIQIEAHNLVYSLIFKSSILFSSHAIIKAKAIAFSYLFYYRYFTH